MPELPNPAAPSMAAASYISAGIVCRPTRNIMKVKPSVAHTSIITSPGIPQVAGAQPVGRVQPDLPQVIVERPGVARPICRTT